MDWGHLKVECCKQQRAVRDFGPPFAVCGSALKFLELHLRFQLENPARYSGSLEVAVGAAGRNDCVLKRAKGTAESKIVGVAEISMVQDVVGVCANYEVEPIFAF